MTKIRSTTILSVRRDGKVIVGGDGQVSLGNTVMKANARKVRRMYDGKVVAGFAGSAADGIALFERLEGKLKEASGNLTRAAVELAKEWRTDRVLRRLEALLVVADAERTFLVTGTGDVIEPEGGVVAVGSGGPYALAAARALMESTSLSAREITERALKIAGDICIYTNSQLSFEEVCDMVRDPRALTPRAIVEELDRYIVGQRAAKRAVAIALRNRWRRQQVPPELRDEIAPKNIIMIGPTGVGKTEIARRLAKLTAAPFLKVEASKFTEVGYVGRDVDSIVRDLTEISVKLVKDEEQAKVRARAREAAEEKLLDALLPRPQPTGPRGAIPLPAQMDAPPPSEGAGSTREKLRELLRAGKLDDREVEIDVTEPQHGVFEVFSAPGMDQIGFDIGKLQSMFGGRGQQKRRKVKVPQAIELLTGEEAGKLIDMDKVTTEAVFRAEQSGIVFLDEIDKIAGSRAGGHGGPDVSREGVQRDLLPIVEGSSVTTKYGVVKTDHVLFIAAGAFHVSKPSDLIPELQGRFPIRVELEPLVGDDFVRILTEPENSLTRQYQALLATEGVRIEWKPDAVAEIAKMAQLANQRMENIGARRLHTIMERLLDELSFEAPGLTGAEVPITAVYVRERLSKVLDDEDLSKYIL